MSPLSDMTKTGQQQHDLIWKALSDATRREILDALAERALSTGELVARFDGHSRTNVMKHIDVLVRADLILVRREGRKRWNYLNPVPIQVVCDRWVSRHVKHMASSLTKLKQHVEARSNSAPLDVVGNRNRHPASPSTC